MEEIKLMKGGECRCSDNLILKLRPDELKEKTVMIFKECEFHTKGILSSKSKACTCLINLKNGENVLSLELRKRKRRD